MFKVLIADDDMLVRMDLRMLIDWHEYDIELLEDAANGADTLKKVDLYNPDIIILDIGMPLINGIEVIARLKQANYQGKIIVLSCHDDFDNVKEALKMGAVDYLLKHLLKSENLVQAVEKAKELIEKDSNDRNEKSKLLQLSEISKPILKDQFVKDLLNGTIDSVEEITDRKAQLGTDIKFTKFIVMLIEVDEMFKLKEKYSQADVDKLLKTLRRIVESSLEGRKEAILGCMEEGRFAVVINFDAGNSYLKISSVIYELCDKILANVESYLNLTVSLGMSKVCQDMCAFSECYTQARLALDGKLYMGKNKIIHFSEVENYNYKLDVFLADWEGEIANSILKSKTQLKECIDKFFAYILEKNVSPESIRTLSFELIAFANKIIKDYGLSYNDAFGADSLPYRYVTQLETINDIKEWFLSICYNISDSINYKIRGKVLKECRPEIKKALEYINMNYMKVVTLQQISDYSGLSRAYFSQLFKEEMNENFSNYLMRYRIEKAGHLLRSSAFKVYEIGLQCGFDSYRYFTKSFKEITGLSPADYRKTNGGK